MTGKMIKIEAVGIFKGQEEKLSIFMAKWSSDYLRKEITSKMKKLIQ